MKRALWKGCGLLLGFTMGCFQKPVPDYGAPEYGVWDSGAQDDDGDGYDADEDCDDGDAAIHPGATEVCDDEADNDCDGAVDADDGDCAD
jgi:hypothetical protein